MDADFCIFFSLCDVRNKAVFLILEHFSPKGLNKKYEKKTWNFGLEIFITLNLIEKLDYQKIFLKPKCLPSDEVTSNDFKYVF